MDVETPATAPPPQSSDEIDIAELFAKLWQGKWWMLGSVLACMAVAVFYLVFVKPTYDVATFVRPPLNSFNEINLSEVVTLNEGEAFNLFRKELEGRQLRAAFFNNEDIKSGFVDGESSLTAEQLFIEFNEALLLKVPVEKKNQVLVSDANSFHFQHFNPEYAVKVVNRLVREADKQAIQNFAYDFNAKKEVKIAFLKQRINDLTSLAKTKREKRIDQLIENQSLALLNAEDDLEILRKKARQKRKDRIAELKEAVSIASELNVIKPTTLSALTQRADSSTSQMAINTEVTNRNEPLYLRGVQHLNAELEALNSRKNDDFTEPAIREKLGEIELIQRDREIEILKARQDDEAFIMDQIAPLQDEIVKLKNLDIDVSALSFARVDQPALVPEKPIKPKKLMVLAGSVFLGGFLGICLALILAVRAKD